MVAALKSQTEICRPLDIAAYVDGELEGNAQAWFEGHLETCEHCRAELRNHRQLICELDAALVKSPELAMPDGFSKLVAARASSDMSGVRSATENRRALGICLILGAAGFALVGMTVPRTAFLKVRDLGAASVALISLLWTAVYDAVASFSVILKVVTRKFVFESKAAAVALVVVAVGVFILSRLIANYHRSSAAE